MSQLLELSYTQYLFLYCSFKRKMIFNIFFYIQNLNIKSLFKNGDILSISPLLQNLTYNQFILLIIYELYKTVSTSRFIFSHVNIENEILQHTIKSCYY